MTKRNWKAVDASLTVRAAKNQESPKSDMIPTMLMSRRTVVLLFCCSFTRPRELLLCLTRMTTTVTKMTALKSRMAKIGPRKAPQNTPGSPMKQLQREVCKVALILMYTYTLGFPSIDAHYVLCIDYTFQFGPGYL